MGGGLDARLRRATIVGAVVLQLGHAAGAGATAPPAAAEGPTLWQRAFEATLVVRARIEHPAWEIPVGEPPTPYPVVEATVLEVLKGAGAPGRLAFARDGHEQPPYTAGQETVLFLQPIARSRALADTAAARAVAWTSLAGAVENVRIPAAHRAAFLAAIHGYAAIAAMPQSAERGARLRALTIELVVSPEPTLARSALRDLALAGNAPLLTRGEATRVGKLIFDPTVPIETRVVLLGESERRGLIFGPTAWARLLRETRGAEQRAVLRGVRGRQNTAVNLELEKLLQGRDRGLALAAAQALGSTANHDAVRPLLHALDTPDPALRRAIIRALGDIRTHAARAALDLVAGSHPDPATRGVALAEVLVLARRQGTTLASMRTSERLPVNTARAPRVAP